MMINLMTIPENQLSDWYRQLLRRDWIWLITDDEPPADAEGR